MKLLKGFGVFFIIVGAIITAIGITPMIGPAIAAGIGVALLGLVTLLAVYSHEVSVNPDHR